MVLAALVLGEQQLGGLDAGQLVGQPVGRDLDDQERAGRQLDPRDAAALLAKADRREVVAAAAVEQVVLGEGAGGDDAHDRALDDALDLLGVLHLLADRDPVAHLHEAAQVAVDGAYGHACHRDRVLALAARRQGDAERFGGKDCDDHDPKIGNCDVDEDGYIDVKAGGDDCDDENPNIHPDAVEQCNEVDDDCDTLIDDADEDLQSAPTWFRDSDGDGFGDINLTVTACLQPSGYVDDNTDCDDGDSAINPAAQEVCDGYTIYRYIYIDIDVSISVSISIYLSVYLSIYLSIYLYMCIYVYIHMYIYIHIYI